jgi:flagellar hook-basal body complex protein FliE
MLNSISPIFDLSAAPKTSQLTPQKSSGVVDFASHLFDVMKQAETTAVGGIQGQIPMQDVVMKIMEAERTFATAMAVRDKAVSAYLEISRMQI